MKLEIRYLILLILATWQMACSGQEQDSLFGETPLPSPTPSPQPAPASISYSTLNSVLKAGVEISPSSPTPDQGNLAGFTFSATPPLPDGLALDSNTGILSGAPRYISSAKTFVITAIKESTQLSVEISFSVGTQFAGNVSFSESHSDNAAGVDGLNEAYRVATSHDGKNVYVSSRSDSSVAVFARDSNTGQLTFLESHFDGIGGVDGLATSTWVTVSHDDKFVYIAGLGDDAIAIFTRNSVNGRLTFDSLVKNGVDGVVNLQGPHELQISPDNNYLYSANYFNNSISLFSRDTSTGRLTQLQTLTDGVNGIDGIQGTTAITITPDGKNVYVCGQSENAIAAFSRNVTNGELAFITSYHDGVDGIDGLSSCFSQQISPDGQHFYVAGFSDDAVTLFERDSGTGRLTLRQMYKDEIDSITGLNGASSIALSPDGVHLYATGRLDNAISVFTRDSDSGQLTVVETSVSGVEFPGGLAGANGVTVSEDGKHVYAVGLTDDSLAVFDRH